MRSLITKLMITQSYDITIQWDQSLNLQILAPSVTVMKYLFIILLFLLLIRSFFGYLKYIQERIASVKYVREMYIIRQIGHCICGNFNIHTGGPRDRAVKSAVS